MPTTDVQENGTRNQYQKMVLISGASFLVAELPLPEINMVDENSRK